MMVHVTDTRGAMQQPYLAGHGLQLLQHRQHEHRGLAHAGLGLADHVHAQDRLGDALVLH